MKKNSILLIALFSVTILTKSWSQLDLGVEAGWSHLGIQNEVMDEYWEPESGFQLGFFLEKRFKIIGVSANIQYELNKFYRSLPPEDVHYSLGYLSIPLMVKYEFFNRLAIAAGPEVKLLINQSEKEGIFYPGFGTEKVDKTDIGIRSQIDINIIKKLSLSIAGYFGLKNNLIYEDYGLMGLEQVEPVRMLQFNSYSISLKYYLKTE